MKTLKTVNPFTPHKSYTVECINQNLFKVSQFINGNFYHSIECDLYNTSEITFNSANALRKFAKPSLLKRAIDWFNKPSKRVLKMAELQAELTRKLDQTNFKYIGGLSVLEQMQVIRLRDGGHTQEFISTKLSTSRGTVIRVLKQRQTVLYISNVFTKISLL